MKMINYLVVAMMLFVAATYGQVNPQDPTPLNDPALSDRLDKDFDSRNATASNAIVNWYNTDYGYYGTYSHEGVDYLTRYDKNGNYIETLNKKDWSTDVSPGVKSSLEKSQYKDQAVKSYWESTDPTKKEYYIELTDKNGKTQRVWLDDKGQFSQKPSSVASNVKPKSKQQ